jgi:hypothetical protein
VKKGGRTQCGSDRRLFYAIDPEADLPPAEWRTSRTTKADIAYAGGAFATPFAITGGNHRKDVLLQALLTSALRSALVIHTDSGKVCLGVEEDCALRSVLGRDSERVPERIC